MPAKSELELATEIQTSAIEKFSEKIRPVTEQEKFAWDAIRDTVIIPRIPKPEDLLGLSEREARIVRRGINKLVVDSVNIFQLFTDDATVYDGAKHGVLTSDFIALHAFRQYADLFGDLGWEAEAAPYTVDHLWNYHDALRENDLKGNGSTEFLHLRTADLLIRRREADGNPFILFMDLTIEPRDVNFWQRDANYLIRSSALYRGKWHPSIRGSAPLRTPDGDQLWLETVDDLVHSMRTQNFNSFLHLRYIDRVITELAADALRELTIRQRFFGENPNLAIQNGLNWNQRQVQETVNAYQRGFVFILQSHDQEKLQQVIDELQDVKIAA